MILNLVQFKKQRYTPSMLLYSLEIPPGVGCFELIMCIAPNFYELSAHLLIMIFIFKSLLENESILGDK